MSEAILTGTSAPIRLKDGKMFDPRQGWTITRRWKGTDAEIQNLAATEALLGNRFQITPADDGGLAILESAAADIENQPADQPLSDIWELEVNSLEKELWELPWVVALFDSITDTQLSGITVTPQSACNWIRRAIEAFITGSDKIKFVDQEEFVLTYDELIQHIFVLQPAVSEGLKPLIKLYAKGVKKFPLGQFVLKRTRVVANNYNVKIEYGDLFKRRTTASLEADQDIPANLIFAMPAGEWVKLVVTYKRTTATKWTITEEWWHADKWEPLIYGDLI